MNLEDVNESLFEVDLEPEQKKAILQLIDLKINSDMKEIISEIRAQNNKFDSKINTMIWVIGIAMTIMLAIIALKK
jgi:hypothetical protein